MMLGAEEVLSLYESVARASGRMLAAARAADWDGLVAHEGQCAQLIERLRTAGGAEALRGSALERKREIILGVLADDAEIRRLAQPRLARLQDMLYAGANRRRLDGAYGP